MSDRNLISVFAEQVLTPDKLVCRINLGFGVTVTKFLIVRRRLNVGQATYDAAMRAMIMLCGRKRLLADMDHNCAAEAIPADLWTIAKNPPPDLMLSHQDKLWLPVNRYMDDLQQTGFDHTVILKHLNGDRSAIAGQ